MHQIQQIQKSIDRTLCKVSEFIPHHPLFLNLYRPTLGLKINERIKLRLYSEFSIANSPICMAIVSPRAVLAPQSSSPVIMNCSCPTINNSLLPENHRSFFSVFGINFLIYFVSHTHVVVVVVRIIIIIIYLLKALKHKNTETVRCERDRRSAGHQLLR